ncbi:hypothetical protein PVAP13_3NG170200 [Panicum virgatum]|uniref:Uncharacterized protein n=1 Tax=Panicum virgatum TaxID=38727 RepID=A0A8T0UFK4_PANVG|nr:hypothetical protein PVAP13_3NG170200 [Panicum virgatum]
MDPSSSVPRRPPRTLPPLELGFGNPSRSHNPSVDDRVALLLRAAHDGYVPKIKKLVERLEKHSGMGVAEAVVSVLFQAPWSKCHGPLHMAAAAGKVDACKYLIRKLKLDVSAAGTDGATPLHFAVHSSGSLAVVKLLLDHNADPNRLCIYGCAPLHIAVIQGSYSNYTIAEELLSRGASVDLLWEHRSPLCMAAQWGDTRMMKLLLHHKAHPNNLLQHTPLKAAIFARSLIGVELLIKAHAGVNFGRPQTPLTAAAATGLTDFVKCLLGAGADANIPDASGRIAIEIAAIQGWWECVEVLFPVTTPLARVADWSIDGIIQHAKLLSSGPQDHVLYEGDDDYEAEGDATFDRRDYSHALTLYTMAMEIDPENSSLYAKRSLCFLNTGHEVKALEDATTYKDMQPDLSKSCYVHRAALLLVEGRAIREERLLV